MRETVEQYLARGGKITRVDAVHEEHEPWMALHSPAHFGLAATGVGTFTATRGKPYREPPHREGDKDPIRKRYRYSSP